MSLHCYKYRLPFTAPVKTSENTFEQREGLILEYATGNFHCYGEVAPLPGFSKETLDNVQQAVGKFAETITASINAANPVETLDQFYKDEEPPAALQFGLDSIAYQLLAFRENKSLRDYLFENAPDRIPVNALCSLHTQGFMEDIEQQISAGFKTIKFKMGLDFDLELKRLQQIRSQFPDLTIRLDANRAWPRNEAVEYCRRLEFLQIEYIEEPLKEVTPDKYEHLSQQTKLPLALDESVSHVTFWPNLLPYTSFLILKPMLLGNFTKSFETKRLAETHGNKVVFTTALESGIGRRITAILASGLGSSQTAHGLTTGKLLNKDVHSDKSYISEGMYDVSSSHQPKIDLKILQDVSATLL